jgi:hypothetical protein
MSTENQSTDFGLLPLRIDGKGVIALVPPTQEHLNTVVEQAGGAIRFCAFADVSVDDLFLWRPEKKGASQRINVAVHNWGPTR